MRNLAANIDRAAPPVSDPESMPVMLSDQLRALENDMDSDAQDDEEEGEGDEGDQQSGNVSASGATRTMESNEVSRNPSSMAITAQQLAAAILAAQGTGGNEQSQVFAFACISTFTYITQVSQL